MKPVLNGTAEIPQLWFFRKDFTQKQNASLQPRLLCQFASLVCSGNPFLPGFGIKDCSVKRERLPNENAS
jgi:hypothetical protein